MTSDLDSSLPSAPSTEIVLQEVVKGTATATGKEFFAVLVESLAAALSVRNCVVSQLLDNGILETLGFFRDNQLQPNIRYDPVGAPCNTVLKENEYYCHSGVRTLFPEHPVLAALDANSYVGVGLQNVDGKILGTLLVIDSNPILDHQLHQSILKIFSGRAAAELERQRLNNELEMRVEQRTGELQDALMKLKETQSQLVQSEKMSSLGQLIAGIAHEINNPNTFILANVSHVANYTEQLLELINHYQTLVPNPSAEMVQLIEACDLEFVQEDLPRLLSSMEAGSDRIQELVHSFRNFSRLGESDKKIADLHDGINSTLVLLSYRLRKTTHRSQIQILQHYGNLPKIECFPGQLNQVFMNILTNAIDALDQRENYDDEEPYIKITTDMSHQSAVICIKNNGIALSPHIQNRIFDPFFTTKPVGEGAGLGLATSYQIVVNQHQGELRCQSEMDKSTKFIVKIPVGFDSGISPEDR